MAISYVGHSTTTYASRTNTTLSNTLSAGSIQNGDILRLKIITATSGADGSAPNPSAPAGFTEIGSVISVWATYGFSLEMRDYIKVASSESGSYTLTHASCTSQGLLWVLRGVDTTTPQDATATANTTTATVTRTATGLTTVTNGAWIEFSGFDFATTSNNLTPPSGMTERIEINPLVYVATEERATAGATGNRSHTSNTAAVSNEFTGARLVALRPAADGGISGTASITEGADTVSATGTVAVAGTASVTEAGDTLSAAGTVAVTGTASITEAGDTVAAAGTVLVSGAAEITEAGDTLEAAGEVADPAPGGVADITEGDDTLAAEGAVAVAGSLSVTEADDTVVSAGAVAVAGAAEITEGADSVAATGTVAVAGSLDATEDDDTLAAEGSVAEAGTILGALAVTEADDTLAADGIADQPEQTAPPAYFGSGGGGGYGYRVKRRKEEDEEPEVTVVVAEPDGEKTTFEVAPAALRPVLPTIAEIMDEPRRYVAPRMVLRPNDDDEVLQIMKLLADME